MPGHQADLTIPSHHVRYISTPLIGAQWSLPTPLGFTARLVGIQLRIITDANVANRHLEIQNDQGGRHGLAIVSPVIQTASLGYTYYGGVAVTAFGPVGPNNDVQVCIPDTFIVRPGDTLTSNFVNLQAGDSWTRIVFAFQEWMTD